MNEKKRKFLIYLDILGFRDLAREIAGDLNVSTIREKCLSEPLREKIIELGKEGFEYTKGISTITGSDNFVLLIDDDIYKMFKVVEEVSMLNLPHKDYDFIPLEIAIDIRDIETGVKIKDLINRDEVIDLLKNDIITPYRELYEDKRGEQSKIKETFILLTNAAFAELKGHNQKDCTKHSYLQKEFYSLPLRVIEREKKISGFLKKTHQSRKDFSGALIDKIFVPPDEFEEIKERLENKRIVFITGTAGYGKTYTAIRLLWEWYNKGYTPGWFTGKEKEDRKAVRESLANIGTALKPKHIIYFEDPFGITEYESRHDLKERITSIILSVKNIKDVYVVITSRKDVFEKFEKESYSVEEIKEFEEEISILKPSYSYEKRREIVEKWAVEKECAWLIDEELKEIVFESIEDKEHLQTPLSIYDFVEATIKIKDERELRQKIITFSEKTEIAFADEIKGLYDSRRRDRILFLSFIFVSQRHEVDFVRTEYEKRKEEDFEDFERILKEEYRVKVEGAWWHRKETLKFSHPSYANALPYLLNHAGCRNIFCRILRELCYSVPLSVAWVVAESFDKLSEVERNLLFELSEKDDTACFVAWAVKGNFDKLPDEVRNSLLLKLSGKRKAAYPVVRAVESNFDKLSNEARNSILLNLSEHDDTAFFVAKTVEYIFDKLPDEVGNSILLNLSGKQKAAVSVARIAESNFDKLPSESRNSILLNISGKDEVALHVARIVKGKFDVLPDKVRNSILLNISENDKVSRAVASTVKMNFDKLFDEVRNSLLLKLS
jgi:hypothetical protein